MGPRIVLIQPENTSKSLAPGQAGHAGLLMRDGAGGADFCKKRWW